MIPCHCRNNKWFRLFMSDCIFSWKLGWVMQGGVWQEGKRDQEGITSTLGTLGLL